MPFSLRVASSFRSITNLHQTNTGNSSSTQAPAFSLRNIRFGGISAFLPVVRLRRTSRRFLLPRRRQTLFLPARNAGKSFEAQGNRFSFRAAGEIRPALSTPLGLGRPKGCMITHENYLEQCVALTSLYP